MKVAIMLIYKSVMEPSYHIIDMDEKTWNKFLDGDKEIACKLLGNNNTSLKIQSYSWMPLEDHEELFKDNPLESVKDFFEKAFLGMNLQHFLIKDTSLSYNQVSCIVKLVKDFHGYGKSKQPAVNDLTKMSLESFITSNHINKDILLKVQNFLIRFGLSFCTK